MKLLPPGIERQSHAAMPTTSPDFKSNLRSPRLKLEGQPRCNVPFAVITLAVIIPNTDHKLDNHVWKSEFIYSVPLTS